MECPDDPQELRAALEEYRSRIRLLTEVLEESERRTRRLYEHAPVMLHSIDSKGRITSVSDQWLERMGYQSHEVIGRASTDFLTEESRRYAREEVLPAFFAQGRCDDIPYQMVTKSGEVLDVLLSAIAERDAEGDIIRSLAVITDITLRKKGEQTLRDSEERWKFALEGARDGVWDWNAATDKVFFSRRWKHMLGYDEADIGDSLAEWDSRIHPDDRDRVYTALNSHLRGETPHYESEHRMRCKDGSYKWILDRGMALGRAEDGSPLRVIGTHTDITDRKSVQARLDRSLSVLEESQRIANVGSWEWITETGEIRWSPQTYRIFGLDPAGPPPSYDEYMERIHPEDRDKQKAAIQGALESGGEYEVQHRVVRPDGEVRHVTGRGHAEAGADGTPARLVGTVQDVTRRMESEQALRDNAAMLQAMSEASYDALIMIDADDIIHFWSPAAEKMFGYTAAEVEGRAMHDIITPPEDCRKAKQGLKQFAHTGQGPVMESIMEFEALRRDGTRFPVERSVAAFPMKSRWYAVGSLRDITERKAAERRLRELAATDPLTGLDNRRHFLETAGRQFLEARRYGRAFSLVMFDADHFKAVNDTWGHDVGDEVLRAIADSAQATVRQVDAVGRLGGEEFCLALPETGRDEALQAAERLRLAIAELRVPAGQQEVRFTISAGVASLDQDTASLEELLKRADQALYAAKKNGRDRVETA